MSNPGTAPLPIFAATAGVEGMHADSADSADGGADHFSHAAGRICENCDRRIEAGQPARRKGADGWVHDVCPPVID